MLLAGALERVLERRSYRAASVAVVLSLAALTRLQLPTWSGDEALWLKAVEASPLSSFALERLADAEAAAGKPGQADGRRAHAQAMRRFVAGLGAQLRSAP